MTKQTDSFTLRHALDYGGSFVYENWRSADSGLRAGDALEYPLYSDARITGETTLGPYEIINTIPDTATQPALVLRAESHVEWSYADMSSTDYTRYHGGTEADEFAALLSLALGCRLKAGNASRYFTSREDPRGRPMSYRSSGRADPQPPIASQYGTLIPNLSAERNLEGATQLLKTFVKLQPAESVVLVKAARLYQEAIWVVEADAALTWLLLVSAIEVVANQWRGREMSARERLRSSKRELEQVLLGAGGEELANRVATMLADSLAPMSKFVSFCVSFLPAAPEPRPTRTEIQLPWNSRGKMKEALGKVYEYRSIALHSGIPFPAPMCSPVFSRGDPGERPAYGAMGGLGGIWRPDDLPMYLHSFEYIVRRALTSWWISRAKG